jgi:hypothetical protein
MEHRQILSGVLAEFGIPMYIQYADIQMGYRNSSLEVPCPRKMLIGNNKLLPKFLISCRGYIGEKPPMQTLNQLEKTHKHRIYPLFLYDRKHQLL